MSRLKGNEKTFSIVQQDKGVWSDGFVETVTIHFHEKDSTKRMSSPGHQI